MSLVRSLVRISRYLFGVKRTLYCGKRYLFGAKIYQKGTSTLKKVHFLDLFLLQKGTLKRPLFSSRMGPFRLPQISLILKDCLLYSKFGNFACSKWELLFVSQTTVFSSFRWRTNLFNPLKLTSG